MKFGYYIIYENPKPVDSLEERIKQMDDFGKVLKKNGMKLEFWGGSFGTTEDFVYVMKGSMESY